MKQENLTRIIWLLILVGPSIFFIRAIMLWAAGGDCLIHIAPETGWFALGVEFIVGGFTTVSCIYCIYRKVPFFKEGSDRQLILGIIILIVATISFTIHLIRFGIYLELCV